MNLSPEKVIPTEPTPPIGEPITTQEPNVVTEPIRTRPSQLKNTNEKDLYDWENQIKITPRTTLKNTNEPYDLENIARGQKETPPPCPERLDVKAKVVDISEIAKRMAWNQKSRKKNCARNLKNPGGLNVISGRG